MSRKLFSLLPLALIALLILGIYLSGSYHLLSFDALQQEHVKLKTYAENHPSLTALYYVGIYVASVVLILPDSIFLSILAGFLFPFPLAVGYVVFSETLGATLFFLATKIASVETLGKERKNLLDIRRTARFGEFGGSSSGPAVMDRDAGCVPDTPKERSIADGLLEWPSKFTKPGGASYKIHEKFHSEQACYLLFFRLSHLLPYWIINMGAGIFHARTWTFIWTTLIGVFPLSFLLVEAGTSLSTYFQTHTHFTLREIFTTQLKLTLLGLGCIALLPVLYKNFVRKKRKS